MSCLEYLGALVESWLTYLYQLCNSSQKKMALSLTNLHGPRYTTVPLTFRLTGLTVYNLAERPQVIEIQRNILILFTSSSSCADSTDSLDTCHPSLSAISLNRSSRLHPVSTQSWCIQVFAGQPILVYQCRNLQENTTNKFIFTSPAWRCSWCIGYHSRKWSC